MTEFDDGPHEQPLSPEEEFMQWDHARQQRYTERPELDIRRALRTFVEASWLRTALNSKQREDASTILVDAVNELMARRKG